MLSDRQLNRALLDRQLLLERRPLESIAALELLVGLQAQVPDAPYVGLWSRLAEFRPDGLAAAVADGDAVRAPLMRCTIHLVSAADWAALQPLARPVLERTFATTPFARSLGGADPAAVAAAARPLLAEPRTRAQLGRELAPRFPGAEPLSLAYAATSLVAVVQVPPRGVWGGRSQAAWMAAEEFLGRQPARSAGAERAVERYLRAFGPAAAADFACWSGLGGARELFERMRPRLRSHRDAAGRELFDLPDASLPDPDTPAPPRFLGEFDNVLLSHRRRGRIIPEGANPPGFGGNGAGAGTVLVDGLLTATWRLDRGRRRLAVAHRTRLPRGQRSEIAAEGDRLVRVVCGRPAEAVEFAQTDV